MTETANATATDKEMNSAKRLLRELCADFGDNDWPDDLHLYDVIEKHLALHLYAEHGEDGCREPELTDLAGINPDIIGDMVSEEFLAAARPVDPNVEPPFDGAKEWPAPDPERKYPCAKCGIMRTKDEGGTTFTVCNACWDSQHSTASEPTPQPLTADEIARWRGTDTWSGRAAATIDALTAELAEAHQRLFGLTEWDVQGRAVATLQALVAVLDSEINGLVRLADERRDEIAALNETVTALGRKIEQADQWLSDAREEKARRITELMAELAKARARIAELESQIGDLQLRFREITEYVRAE